jgi:tRNA nucleotidyltransferase (CCA-adding enzyme)
MTAQYHTLVHTAAELRPETVHRLFRDADALRRPERFHMMLEACLADARGRLHFEDCAYPQTDYLKALLDAARAVDAGAIAKQCTDPREIPRTVEAARVAAIAQAKKSNPISARP